MSEVQGYRHAFFQLMLGSSCEHVLESKKATGSVVREKNTHS